MSIVRSKKYYKIYKFDTSLVQQRRKNKDQSKINKLSFQRADEAVKFQIKLINDMNTETFEDLVRFTLYAKHLQIKPEIYMCIRYGKPGYKMWDQYEIGMDQMYIKYKMLYEHHRHSTYYLIPIEQKDLIEYFDENVPLWVKTLKRI